MASLIPLSGPRGYGEHALVDDEDYEYLVQFTWNLSRNGYAIRAIPRGTSHSTVLMHREVMGAEPNVQVDHINHNPLDNRHSNLRLASAAENQRNSHRRADNTSGYKGVSRSGHKWQAYIQVDSEWIYLGVFGTPEAAARAYDNAATFHFGEFALLNFGGEQ